METIYGLLFKSDEEKSLKDSKEVIRQMENPTLYNNVNSAILSNYSLILSQTLDHIELDGTDSKFVDTDEYDLFFEAVVRMFTDNTFISNKIYEKFFITGIEDKMADGYISFIFASKVKFVITNKPDKFKLIYPNPNRYYVVFDETQNVDNDEMIDLMAELCNNLGRDNMYNSVKRWNYTDIGVKLSFYIFYSGVNPTELICQEVVRTYVIGRYGLEEAKRRFPRLFISTKRKVFCLYDNEIKPINYDLLVRFIDKYNILSPEVVHVLDYVSPIIVEYGLSDIYPTFSSQTTADYMNNTFLFYISQVLNYYNGKKLTKEFIEESEFVEYDEYSTVVTAGVEWMIMKRSYEGAYLPSEDDN